MHKPAPDPYTAACPSRALVSLIGDKWTLLLLPVLAQGPQRPGALLRRIEGLSQKMLTQTLRQLETHNIVLRTDHNEVPPKVDYRLTELGQSLATIIGALDQWVIDNFDSLWPSE